MYGRPPCEWSGVQRSDSAQHSSAPAEGEGGLGRQKSNTTMRTITQNLILLCLHIYVYN